jgi:hypothetical protein
MELMAVQNLVAFSKSNRLPYEVKEVSILATQLPIDPEALIVLAIGIIVTVLAAQKFVAAKEHGRSEREEQMADMIFGHFSTQF